MDGDIQTGTKRQIADDIVIDGILVFKSKELVTVERIDPDSERPEYQYLVSSKLTQRQYKLRDRDLLIPLLPTLYDEQPPSSEPLPPEPLAPQRIVMTTKRRSKAVPVTLVVLLVLIIGGILLLTLSKKKTETGSTNSTVSTPIQQNPSTATTAAGPVPTATAPVTPAPSVTPTAGTVNLQTFYRLQTDMSYDEVSMIIGSPGTVTAQTGVKTEVGSTLLYTWPGSPNPNSYVDITFQVQKRASGLVEPVMITKKQVGLE